MYFVQAVPLSARKVSDRAVGSGEGIASFLQLPHFSEQVVKKIGRKVGLLPFVVLGSKKGSDTCKESRNFFPARFCCL